MWAPRTQTDFLADDVDIDFEKLSKLSIGQARAYFESGGDWVEALEQGEIERFEKAHARPRMLPFDATSMANMR